MIPSNRVSSRPARIASSSLRWHSYLYRIWITSVLGAAIRDNRVRRYGVRFDDLAIRCLHKYRSASMQNSSFPNAVVAAIALNQQPWPAASTAYNWTILHEVMIEHTSALEPPPTQAIQYLDFLFLFCQSCFFVSAEIIDWKRATISG